MSSSNQRSANRGCRSVLRCALSHYRQFPWLSAPEPCERVKVLDLTLPDSQNLPAEHFELRILLGGALLILFEFRKPVVKPGFRNSAVTAAMGMPETPMHENSLAPRGESQIRLTGKVFALKAIAVAHTMCQTSHSHFRLRIPSLDGPHHLTALFRAFRHFRILIFRLGSVPMSSAWRWARPTSRPGSFDDGS